MDNECFIEKILKLISLKQEGDYWDFKKQWYTNKSDLLHDIICMANNISSNDGYIIIGVDEESDYSILDVTNDPERKQTQDIVCFLRDKKFAGGIRPTVFVKVLSVSNMTIDVIVVQNDRNTPYYLSESFRGVFANNIYTRIMDTNTPKTSSADVDIVEKLWKKRFGLDATAMERAMLFLRKSSNWIDSDFDRKFHKYFPEYTIEQVSADEHRDGYEFYLFNQCDPRPRWYDINIYYHQTLLSSLGGAALDGGRCFTSTPSTYGISLSPRKHEWDVVYKYFIKDSIEYIVHQFYITSSTGEEFIARQRFLECILVFESNEEKSEFDSFVKNEYSRYNRKDFEDTLPYFREIKGYNMDELKKQYVDSQLLKQMLSDFRKYKK